MLRRPPISTRADILFPYTALVRAGGKVVAAMRRAAKPGEFRSNLHRGGTATAAKLSPQERELAVRAAKVMGLGVAGVDMLRSNRGPLVLEVNSSPGLEGIEAASGVDVAGAMIDRSEERRVGEGGFRTCRSRWWP